jgi:hypothetical protein
MEIFYRSVLSEMYKRFYCLKNKRGFFERPLTEDEFLTKPSLDLWGLKGQLEEVLWHWEVFVTVQEVAKA